MDIKICGVKDLNTLNYIIQHPHPPWGIGFIANYKKSKRYVEFENLKKLLNVDKKGINFISVLVNPDDKILEKIKKLKFDYYQLYDVSPRITKVIKEKYKIKIISALKINNKDDVDEYKKYEKTSDIILFDGQGYHKSIGFNHALLETVPNRISKMIAGNLKIEDISKFKNIKDCILDLSGSLEKEKGVKDVNKIDKLLNSVHNN